MKCYLSVQSVSIPDLYSMILQAQAELPLPMPMMQGSGMHKDGLTSTGSCAPLSSVTIGSDEA